MIYDPFAECVGFFDPYTACDAFYFVGEAFGLAVYADAEDNDSIITRFRSLGENSAYLLSLGNLEASQSFIPLSSSLRAKSSLTTITEFIISC